MRSALQAVCRHGLSLTATLVISLDSGPQRPQLSMDRDFGKVVDIIKLAETNRRGVTEPWDVELLHSPNGTSEKAHWANVFARLREIAAGADKPLRVLTFLANNTEAFLFSEYLRQLDKGQPDGKRAFISHVYAEWEKADEHRRPKTLPREEYEKRLERWRTFVGLCIACSVKKLWEGVDLPIGCTSGARLVPLPPST